MNKNYRYGMLTPAEIENLQAAQRKQIDALLRNKPAAGTAPSTPEAPAETPADAPATQSKRTPAPHKR